MAGGPAGPGGHGEAPPPPSAETFGESTEATRYPQVVPRPPGAHPGAPAPWAALPASARRGLSLDLVIDRLSSAGQLGPGPPVGAKVDPWVSVLAPSDVPGGPAAAAVLVALFEDGRDRSPHAHRGECRVVLTRRSNALRAHRGEVSFPGGRIEAGEHVPAAAVREAHEEVGLDPAAVTVVGWLHPVLTVASGAHITPVVASLAQRPELRANPSEVERVFDVALADLAADGVFHEERWRVEGRRLPSAPDGSFPVWFYETAGELIWGATARMLTELLSVVLGVGLPGPAL